jgi:hypothetical protein
MNSPLSFVTYGIINISTCNCLSKIKADNVINYVTGYKERGLSRNTQTAPATVEISSRVTFSIRSKFYRSICHLSVVEATACTEENDEC